VAVLGTIPSRLALAELGQVADGIKEMEKGIAGLRKLGGAPRYQFSLVMLAQAYTRMNRADKALAMLEGASGCVQDHFYNQFSKRENFLVGLGPRPSRHPATSSRNNCHRKARPCRPA
jgi:hypothetical protein